MTSLKLRKARKPWLRICRHYSIAIDEGNTVVECHWMMPTKMRFSELRSLLAETQLDLMMKNSKNTHRAIE